MWSSVVCFQMVQYTAWYSKQYASIVNSPVRTQYRNILNCNAYHKIIKLNLSWYCKKYKWDNNKKNELDSPKFLMGLVDRHQFSKVKRMEFNIASQRKAFKISGKPWWEPNRMDFSQVWKLWVEPSSDISNANKYRRRFIPKYAGFW